MNALSLHTPLLYLFVSTLIMYNTIAQAEHIDQEFVLDAKLLAIIDGNFLDGKKVQDMYFLRNKIYEFLYGVKKEVELPRTGLYLFDNKWCTLHDLLKYEEIYADQNSSEIVQKKHTLHALLEQSKNEFIRLSKKFSAEARSVKSVTIRLIEESCQKRGRGDSLLLKWAELTSANETEVFDTEITTFKAYVLFLTDLYNFLHDLSHSCPKAMKQFKERVAKAQKIQELIPAALSRLQIHIDQKEFVRALKLHYVDTVKQDVITVDLVCELIKHFISKKGEPLYEQY